MYPVLGSKMNFDFDFTLDTNTQITPRAELVVYSNSTAGGPVEEITGKGYDQRTR